MLTSPAEQPRQGTVLGGKYRLTRSLGTGSMGSVWAAINETTSREVAVKLILGSSPDLRRRLLREARLCGALRHPNIIDMYDVAETADGEPFLVMELLSGETLAQLLTQKRRLESSQAARIALDAARALEAAHALGIIHRDLKPANIFLHSPPGSADPVVKVLDFGVAKNLVDDDGLRTVIGGLVGSPAYMSPEQARADRTIDHRSDLWSLGVVLFQMLTGTRPFNGDPQEVLQKLDKGPIATVSELVRDADPRLSAVVARCLTRDRDERISSAAEVVRLLEAVVNADRSAAAPLSPRAPSSSPRDAVGRNAARGSGPEGTAILGVPSPRFPALAPALVLAPASPSGASDPASRGIGLEYEVTDLAFPAEPLQQIDESDASTMLFERNAAADPLRRPASPALSAPPWPRPVAGRYPDAAAYPVTAVVHAPKAGPWEQGARDSSTKVLPAPEDGRKVPGAASAGAPRGSKSDLDPGGTLKISPAEVDRFRPAARAWPMGADSTTAPLVQSASDVPPPSARPQSSSGVITMPRPDQSFRTALVLPVMSIGLSLLLVAILHGATSRGSAAAPAPPLDSRAMAETPITVPVPSQTPERLEDTTLGAPRPGSQAPGAPALPDTKPPVAKAQPPARPPVTPGPAQSDSAATPKPQTAGTASPRAVGTSHGSSPGPSNACAHLKFLERERCLKAGGFKPQKL